MNQLRFSGMHTNRAAAAGGEPFQDNLNNPPSNEVAPPPLAPPPPVDEWVERKNRLIWLIGFYRDFAICMEKDMESCGDLMVTQLETEVIPFVWDLLAKLRCSMAVTIRLSEVERRFVNLLTQILELEPLLEQGVEVSRHNSTRRDHVQGQQQGQLEQNLELRLQLNPPHPPLLESLDRCKRLKSFLLTHAMSPDQQPPHLVQKGVPFTTSVRLWTSLLPWATPSGSGLAGPHSSEPQPSCSTVKRKKDEDFVPQIRFKIVRKRQLKRFYRASRSGEIPPFVPPEDDVNHDLTGNVGKVDSRGSLSAQFRGATIKWLERTIRSKSGGSSSAPSRKGNSKTRPSQDDDENDDDDDDEEGDQDEQETSAMSERFSIKFYTFIFIDGQPQEISSSSRPFIYYTNSKQQTEAKGTLFWDTWFTDYDDPDTPFRVVDRVSLSRFCRAINAHFHQELGPQLIRPLSQFHLVNLTNILINGDTPPNEPHVSHIDEARLMDRQALFFCRQPRMTNWRWWSRVTHLIQSCPEINNLWNSGHMIGIMDGSMAEQHLINQNRPGMFLMRFSCDELAVVVLSYLTAMRRVVHVPFTESALRVISLAESIRREHRFSEIYFLNDDDGRHHILNKFDVFPPPPQVLPSRPGDVVPLLVVIHQVTE